MTIDDLRDERRKLEGFQHRTAEMENVQVFQTLTKRYWIATNGNFTVKHPDRKGAVRRLEQEMTMTHDVVRTVNPALAYARKAIERIVRQQPLWGIHSKLGNTYYRFLDERLPLWSSKEAALKFREAHLDRGCPDWMSYFRVSLYKGARKRPIVIDPVQPPK